MLGRCPVCGTPRVDETARCCGCGAAAEPAPREPSLTAALAQAARLVRSGELDHAIALLRPYALRPEPEPQATFALGAAFLQRGQYAEALPLLAHTVARRPEHAWAHAYLGMAQLHTYQPAEARAALDRARALAPDDFVVNLKYGELLLRLGYFREAIAPLEHALAVAAPDGSSLAFAQRLLRLARQKAPNTFSRQPQRLPTLRWLRRLARPAARPQGAGDAVLPELG